jgi:TRAP-type C4-dicarboxylate transport system permease small subunit
LRNLVLWIGFIGATLATREGKHINIDVVSRSLPPLARPLVEAGIHLFSFVICGLLTYASLKFVMNEAEMKTMTFVNIPAWILELILPLTFGLMAFRFALRTVRSFSFSVEMIRTRDQGTDE